MADELLEQMVASKLGPTAAGPQETGEGQVMETAAPNDVPETSAEAGDSPVEFEVDFDGEMRRLSPEQIKSTYGRYADLNYRMTQMAPVMRLAEKILQNTGGEVTPQQLAQAMETALKAGLKNTTMGNTESGEAEGEAPDSTEDDLAKWAEENAVTLPPGYADMRRENKNLKGQLERMAQIMSAMLNQQRQGVQQFQQQMGQATQQVGQQSVNVVKQQIANNLQRAQQQFQLPDSDETEFMNFAAQRGYTIEDFVNPDLTMTVAQDFINAKNSGELERMRMTANRRQAYTGSVASQPTGDAASGGPRGGNDPIFEGLVNRARQSRFG